MKYSAIIGVIFYQIGLATFDYIVNVSKFQIIRQILFDSAILD